MSATSTIESIPIPAERVPLVARETASSSKSVGALLLFLFVIIAVASLGVLVEDSNVPTDSAERAGNVVGKIIGIGLFAGIPGLLGFRALRNASRAIRAATAAQTASNTSFVLSNNLMIAADGAGTPQPELSFKVNGAARRMLLAVPRAEVVDRKPS